MNKSHLNGGNQIQLGCHRVTEIPITFPRSGSMITFYGHDGGQLKLQFDFRSVRENAVLVNFNLITLDLYDSGNLEVIIYMKWLNICVKM